MEMSYKELCEWLIRTEEEVKGTELQKRLRREWEERNKGFFAQAQKEHEATMEKWSKL